MSIIGTCERCGGETSDYECLRCIRRALEALLEVCNRILEIEDGGKNYIADLAQCKREIVLPALGQSR